MSENQKTKRSKSNQGLTFCRKDFKAPNLQPQGRCEKCGFRLRGVNHLSGKHCRNGNAGRTGAALQHARR